MSVSPLGLSPALTPRSVLPEPTEPTPDAPILAFTGDSHYEPDPAGPPVFLVPIEAALGGYAVRGMVIGEDRVTHQIQPGDTLSGIARDYNLGFGLSNTWRDIHEANPWIEEPGLIRTSMPELEIPGLDDALAREAGLIGGMTRWRGEVRHQVRPGETLSRIAGMYEDTFGLQISYSDLVSANPSVLPNPDRISSALEPLVIPGLAEYLDRAQQQPSGLVEVNGDYRHQVQAGDTLTAIAETYNRLLGLDLTAGDIAAANPGVISSPDRIWPGMTPLHIPGLDQAIDNVAGTYPSLRVVDGEFKHQIRSGDTLFGIARQTNELFGLSNSYHDIVAANPDIISDPARIFPSFPPLTIPGIMGGATDEADGGLPSSPNELIGESLGSRQASIAYGSGRSDSRVVDSFTASRVLAKLDASNPAGAAAQARAAVADDLADAVAVVSVRNGQSYLVALDIERVGTAAPFGRSVVASNVLAIGHPAVEAIAVADGDAGVRVLGAG